ncbi:hypothetical protein B0H14DRAFT_3169618 [Mycena olivaceomarginata]|nr:hypothetical protein B0H14DRAFT_3169618 [Mycena olivaceomarginata]
MKESKQDADFVAESPSEADEANESDSRMALCMVGGVRVVYSPTSGRQEAILEATQKPPKSGNHPDAHAGKAIRWLVVAYHNLSIAKLPRWRRIPVINASDSREDDLAQKFGSSEHWNLPCIQNSFAHASVLQDVAVVIQIPPLVRICTLASAIIPMFQVYLPTTWTRSNRQKFSTKSLSMPGLQKIESCLRSQRELGKIKRLFKQTEIITQLDSCETELKAALSSIMFYPLHDRIPLDALKAHALTTITCPRLQDYPDVLPRDYTRMEG